MWCLLHKPEAPAPDTTRVKVRIGVVLTTRAASVRTRSLQDGSVAAARRVTEAGMKEIPAADAFR
jgi:hypothetical protein